MTNDPEFALIADALRAHVHGLFPDEAAVELLIGHRTWLTRCDFTREFVHAGRVGDQEDEEWVAVIDWSAAVDSLREGRLPCSGSEQRVLRIAASLGSGIPVDLRENLTELDRTNSALVASAVRHASGQRPTTGQDRS